jgi:2-oxo-4-hydroxy-4-carboxy-5-ureidoimidazoline decarboxylase
MKLEELNQAPPEQAAARLTGCCGASQWAREMLMLRPFTSPEHLFRAADEVWWSLDADDWHEAFRAHPRIGERKAAAAQSQQAAAWSAGEQAGMSHAPDEIAAALAEGNRRYEERFGYIYIVCATGRGAGEMLALLRHRLDHAPEDEIRVAAAEQAKITRLRLEKLLGV